MYIFLRQKIKSCNYKHPQVKNKEGKRVVLTKKTQCIFYEKSLSLHNHLPALKMPTNEVMQQHFVLLPEGKKGKEKIFYLDITYLARAIKMHIYSLTKLLVSLQYLG